MNSDRKAFDPRTLFLVVAVGIVFFGWQKYLEYKYPDFYSKKYLEKPVTEEVKSVSQVAGSNNPSAIEKIALMPEKSQKLVETIPVSSKLWSGKITSAGMGLIDVQDLNYKDSDGNPILFSSGLPLLEVIDLSDGKAIHFELSSFDESTYLGKGVTNDGTTILRKIQVNSGLGSLVITTELSNISPTFKGFGIKMAERLKRDESSSFLMPNLNVQEFVVRQQGSVEHLKFADDLNQEISKIDLFAISSQYFTVGYLDKSSIMANAQLFFDSGIAFSVIKYLIPTSSDKLSFESVVFIGPKSFDLLTNVDRSLTEIINFGFFSTIASVLLKLLKFLNHFVHNWGLAIILLTLVVRLLVLPFNILSYRSMKKMQLIQPKLKILREKYKDDPAALNRETMNLMKNEKVNPLGGCLPMFLQMPVFFALYQVLGQSVELYQAPFILWIKDLSSKDPYYVLPVLLGITLFVQHRITPTTMDPQQAKIMMWMPLIFSVFTLGLPAGLTLYIFISTLFGVIQQQIFMMDKR